MMMQNSRSREIIRGHWITHETAQWNTWNLTEIIEIRAKWLSQVMWVTSYVPSLGLMEKQSWTLYFITWKKKKKKMSSEMVSSCEHLLLYKCAKGSLSTLCFSFSQLKNFRDECSTEQILFVRTECLGIVNPPNWHVLR